MVFQQFNLINRLTAWTNVMTGNLGAIPSWMGLFGYFPKDSINHAYHHLETVGIADKAKGNAGNLSGGQQQRVGIARALMQNPSFILADEPISSLDPTSAKSIMDLLKEINESKGVTIVCCLHLPHLASEYGQRIMVLSKGELVFDGSSKSLSGTEVESLLES